jgi:flagellar biosynthesis protein FlhG
MNPPACQLNPVFGIGFLDKHFFMTYYGHMTTIIPVASGKGGVGKTLISANLGISLANLGKTVILVDLDLGGSNLHTCLGIKNNHSGIGSYIYHQSSNLESLIVETEVNRLYLIPGDSLLPGTANLQFFIKNRIINEIAGLTADFVVLDLGSGSAYNTVDFFLSSAGGLIVTAPETTAILNAYSFIKTCLFRMLYRSFPAKSPERKFLGDFAANRIEGTGESFLSLVDSLGRLNEKSGDTVKTKLEQFLPRVIINMGRTNEDLAIGAKLRQIVRKNLAIEVEYIGFLSYDQSVGKSVLSRKPLALSMPEIPFVKTLDLIARKIILSPVPSTPKLFEANEDLLSLSESVL